MLAAQNIIFAPATGVGQTSITVIRISGPGCWNIISKCFTVSKSNIEPNSLSAYQPNSIVHGYLFNSVDVEEKIVDEVLLSLFKEPHSFTGEDIVEISTHGGAAIYNKVSDLLVKLGCIPADPGEFSKRAFLNGKIDLIQAEAIADLISAKSELSRKSAISQLNGSISGLINELRTDLINYCSLIELEIDFSEEGLTFVRRDELLKILDNIIVKIDKLTNSYNIGRFIHSGINVAIVGKPNVGKSTIFNALLSQDRAIVTPIPGTTRDYLQESISIDGYLFNFIDTAGLRETQNIIEKEGITRTNIKIDSADLILEIADITSQSESTSFMLQNSIKVYNKIDLVKEIPNTNGHIYTSGLNGVGLTELKNKLVKMAKSSGDLIESGNIITNQRHHAALLKTCEYLKSVHLGLQENRGNELLSIDLRSSLQYLGELIGRVENVDILNNIFAKFCIGK